MRPVPMFPLGSVLFPGAVLPLQIFEPRYRELIADIQDADRRFGVVLIERGSEVGGGDKRTDVGTMAELVRIGDAEDGRILIVAVGRERIRVVDWLEDDPYPRATVEPYPGGSGNGNLDTALANALAARRRLVAFALEMGAAGQSLDLDLPDAPLQASWALCAAAPIGPLDQQMVLATAGAVERMVMVNAMLSEQTETLKSTLKGS